MYVVTARHETVEVDPQAARSTQSHVTDPKNGCERLPAPHNQGRPQEVLCPLSGSDRLSCSSSLSSHCWGRRMQCTPSGIIGYRGQSWDFSSDCILQPVLASRSASTDC